jgi:hypothetical protein
MKINIPSHLSDDDLVAKVRSLVGREREATVDLIAHLAELDARRLYLGAGFSSLFTYCMEVLRLSEAEAYNRIEAARAARRFPVILDRLAVGSLNLTTVRLLASHLTVENHLELLAGASGKTRREVEELRARYFPQPDVASSVRKLSASSLVQAQAIAASTPSANMTATGASVTPLAEPVPRVPVPAPRRPVVAALAPDRYQIRFTATAETCEKLRLAQDMLRHAVPTGDTGEIIDRALTALLEELARKKFAKTDRPRASRGVLDPYGVGGEATVEMMELRCRAHNNYEAELFYGRPQPTRSGTSSPPPPAPTSRVTALAVPARSCVAAVRGRTH